MKNFPIITHEGAPAYRLRGRTGPLAGGPAAQSAPAHFSNIGKNIDFIYVAANGSTTEAAQM